MDCLFELANARSLVDEGELNENGAVEVVEEVAPILEDGGLVLVLGKLVVDVVKTDSFGVETGVYLTDAVLTHFDIGDRLLRRLGNLLCLFVLFQTAEEAFFLWRWGYDGAAHALDRAAETLGIDYLGGYSALVHKGIGDADRRLMNCIPEALAATSRVCSSVNVASLRAGINMDAVLKVAEIVRRSAELTADADSVGASKFVVFANMVEDSPFMAGAVHGSGEADAVINVGVSGPGVMAAALEELPESASMMEVAEKIKQTAFKITRAGELMSREAARRLGVEKGIVDLSLAPTPAIGDSVARILEIIGVGTCGGPGTTAALALLNDCVKKGGVMATSSVGGLSGAFIPVSEDAGMIAAGTNPETGLVEVIELKDHPWFVGTQYHPEYKSTVATPAPLFVSFVRAAMEYGAAHGLEEKVAQNQ